MTNTRDINIRATGDSSDAVGAIDQLGGALNKLDVVVAVTTANIATKLITNLTRGFNQALQAAKGFTEQSTILAGRLETLQVSLNLAGANAGYTAKQMGVYEEALKTKGITTEVARQALMRMMRAEIDLASATDLASMAQDAAVVAGEDSSATFNRIIYALQTGNTLLIDQLGLVFRHKEYLGKQAKALGKSVEALTQQEKAQARVNDLMEQAGLISGAYDSAMETAAKQATSLVRHQANVMEEYGNMFQPVYAQKIKIQTELWKTLFKFLQKNQPAFERIGQALGRVAEKARLLATEGFGRMLRSVSKVLDPLSRLLETISGIIQRIEEFTAVLIALRGALFAVGGALAGLLVATMLPALGGLLLSLVAFLTGPIGLLMALGAALGFVASAVMHFRKTQEEEMQVATQSLSEKFAEQQHLTEKYMRAMGYQEEEIWAELNNAREKREADRIRASYNWGQQLILQFAQGMADAIGYVIQALTNLGRQIAAWLAPSSPPKILPDIIDWGKQTMSMWAEGMLSFDLSGHFNELKSTMTSGVQSMVAGFDMVQLGVFQKVTSALDVFIRKLGTWKEIGEGEVIPTIKKMRTQVASVIKELKAGNMEVVEQTITTLANSFENMSESMQLYIRSLFEVEVAQTRLERAQAKLNNVTQQYDALLRPLSRELDTIRRAQADLAAEEERARLEKIIGHHTTSKKQKEAARLALRELDLVQEMRDLEGSRAEEVEPIQQEIDSATAALAIASDRFDMASAMVDVISQQNDLLAEQANLMAQAAGIGGGGGLADLLEDAGGGGGLDLPPVSSMAILGDLPAQIEQFITDLKKPFDDLMPKIEEMGKVWNDVWLTIQKKWHQYVDPIVEGLDGLGIELKDVVKWLGIALLAIAGLRIAWKGYKAVMALALAFRTLKGVLAGSWLITALGGGLKNVGGWVTGKMVPFIWFWLQYGWALLLEKLGTLIGGAGLGGLFGKIGAGILAVLTAPITWLIVAIIGLIALIILTKDRWIFLFGQIWTITKLIFAKIKDWVVEKWDQVKETVASLWGQFKTILGLIWVRVKKVFGQIKDWIVEKWENIKDVFKGLGKVLTVVWEKIKEKAFAAWERIKDVFKGLGEVLKAVWKKIKEKAVAAWEKIKEAIAEKWQDIRTEIKKRVLKIRDEIKKKFEEIRENLTKIWDGVKEKIRTKIDELKNTFKQKFEEIKEKLKKIWEDIKESVFVQGLIRLKAAIKKRLDKIRSEFTQMWKKLKPKLVELVQEIKARIIREWVKFKDKIRKKLQDIVEEIKRLWGVAMEWMSDKLKTAKKWILKQWTTIKEKVGKAVSDVAEKIKYWWGIAMEWMRDKLDVAKKWILKKWELIKRTVAGAVLAVAEKIKYWWGIAMEWMRDKLEMARQWIGEKWEAIKERVRIALLAIVEKIQYWWGTALQFVQDKLEAAKTWITEKWEAIKTAITDKVTEIWTVITTKWEEIKTAIETKVTEIWTAITTKWEEIKTAIETKVGEIWTVITTKWDEIKTAVATKVEEVWTSISDWFGEMVKTVTDKVKEIWTAITEKWDEIKTAVGIKVFAVWSKISTWFGSMVTTINTKLGLIWTAITTKWDELITAVGTKVEAVWQSISDWFGEMVLTVGTKIDEVYDIVTGVIDTIEEFFALDRIVEKLKTIGGNIIDGLVEGLIKFAWKVTDFFGTLIDSLIGGVKSDLEDESPSKVFMRIGENIMKGWMIGLEKGEDDVPNFLGSVIKQIAGLIEGAGMGEGSPFSSMVSVGEQLMMGLLVGMKNMEQQIRNYLLTFADVTGGLGGTVPFDPRMSQAQYLTGYGMQQGFGVVPIRYESPRGNTVGTMHVHINNMDAMTLFMRFLEGQADIDQLESFSL